MHNFFNKNINIILLFSIYLLTFYYYFQYGLPYYDDWSIIEHGIYNPNIISSVSSYLTGGFGTRPFAAIILGVVSQIKNNFYIYLLLIVNLNFLYAYLVFKSFSLKMGKSFSIILFLLLLFPNFNSNNIFSPAAQGLGIFSLVIWSLSLYLNIISTNKKIYYFSWVLFVISVLTYEITFVLILINLLLPKINNKIFYKNIYLTIFNNKNVIFLGIIILLCILIYQIFLTKLFNIYISNRYKFNNLSYFGYILEYWYVPIGLWTSSISLYLRGLIHYFANHNLQYLISIFFLICAFYLTKNQKYKEIIFIKNLIYISILVYVLIIFFFIIARSIPNINSYYNRALGAYNLIFNILVISLVFEFIKKEKIRFLILFLIVLINYNAFNLQIKNNVESSKIRKNIIDDIKIQYSKDNNTNNRATVFAKVPTTQEKNFNNELIFSEEVYDFNLALLISSDQKISGMRIYNDNECKKVLQIQKEEFSFYEPSRSKLDKNKKIDFIKYDKNFNYYIYNYKDKDKKNFYKIDNKSDIEKILKDMQLCYE